MKLARALFLVASLPLCGCKSQKADTTVPPTEVPALPAPKVTVADIIGSWRIDYVSGTSHPTVGGVIELSEDGRMIALMPSGDEEEAKTPTFWHLLTMESGDVIIAIDSTFSISSDFSPVLDQLEMPMAVVIDGDTMSWNLLTREKVERASPSDKAAYKFTRK